MMKKMPILFATILIVVGMFSGCTSYQSGNRYNDWDFYHENYNESDFNFYLETSVFDFSDVVTGNGSVFNTTKIIIPLIIENKNDFFKINNIEFEIIEFPLDLQVWSTSVFLTIDGNDAVLPLFEDYDFSDPNIGYLIAPNIKVKIIYLTIQLDKTVEKTYSDNEIYVCHLEISYETNYERYSLHGSKIIGFTIAT